MKENKIDPLQECLHENTYKDTQSERQTKGLIVFFHGSPAEGKFTVHLETDTRESFSSHN